MCIPVRSWVSTAVHTQWRIATSSCMCDMTTPTAGQCKTNARWYITALSKSPSCWPPPTPQLILYHEPKGGQHITSRLLLLVAPPVHSATTKCFSEIFKAGCGAGVDALVLQCVYSLACSLARPGATCLLETLRWSESAICGNSASLCRGTPEYDGKGRYIADQSRRKVSSTQPVCMVDSN